ncbi:non-ribosomal peptide synthetase [Cohnella cholangitidis]|uniref:Amino acid adenylation domain-containing protein n=1 Tax=Cohnella cholangitidis TaxID=2598458 RepID=A0A7G5BS79_9BACL|nr:non-ribosomal peptide synthetase [Cohnella cholangitidis]QMV39813.1 amino acid adenylation domain-containing protein [Cohnella cholangitidis]
MATEKAWWESEGEEELPVAVEETSNRDIAIIGMAVRLPDAEDVTALWDKISTRHDAVGPFPEQRRKDVESLLAGTKLPGGKISYYDGAYLSEIDKFDFRFFRLSPKEAALMSPNQRLWLEVAWNAIEDSGYGANKLAGSSTGVYLGYNGDSFHDYKRLIAEREPESLSLAIPGNLSSIAASRISYLLDFKGPSLTVDTACSSSLVALHLAVQALRAGECEQALVGGVKTYLLPVDLGIKIGIESPDFRARTFDDGSAGTGGGEGAAAVLLKPLGKAIRDKDAIYAVIKGSAINQDGASIGITAPNGRAQEEAIVKSWQDAGVDPTTIGYIEAHGTGTKLGDPIEIGGITQAFRRYTDRRQFCAIGSIKTNYGHLDTAAGIVGLIKAALALRHRQLPPMLHFRQPNREIPFADSPVYVSDVLRPWPEESGEPLRAGVSSFGMSGTNAHAVLEEAPRSMVAAGAWDGIAQPLTLSAKSPTALLAIAASYREYAERCTDLEADASDFCYTANTGRGHYEFRAVLTVRSIGELRDKLLRLESELSKAADETGSKRWKDVAMLTDNNGLATGIWLGKADSKATSESVKAAELSESGLEAHCLAYAKGGNWDWEAYYRDRDVRKIHIPAYRFDRTRCWLEETGASRSDYAYPFGTDAVTESDRALTTSKGVILTGRDNGGYTETEQTVADAWGRGLGFSSLGINEHYYELGGDSILALTIVDDLGSRMGREISVADLLSYPTVLALAAHLDQSGLQWSGVNEETRDPLLTEEREFPLSRAQLRIFLGAQLPGAERHHHMPMAYVVEGKLDAARLEEAFRKLAERHESLRTTFDWSDDGVPRQIVHPDPVMRVETQMLSGEDEWPSYASSFVRPFDLSRLPLLRVGLASVSAERHLLLLDSHHLIADGSSLALLLQEMQGLYGGASLPPKEGDYRNYVAWQQEQTDSPSWQAQRAYWLDKVLASPVAPLRLPLDEARPRTRSGEGRVYRFTVPRRLTEELQRLAKERQVSLHTVLYALYAVLMQRYTGQEDLVIGSLVSGRDRTEFRQLVGVMINFLPVRVTVPADIVIASLLDQVEKVTRDAYANGQFPFDEMIEAVAARGDRSRNPLYDTMLVFHNHAAGSDRLQAGNLVFREYGLDKTTSALDVKLDLFPGAEGELNGVFEYDSILFREESIARMAEHFIGIAAWAASGNAGTIGELSLFEPEEEAGLERRRALNDTARLAAPERSIEVRVASTFTSEPIADTIGHWLEAFGCRTKVSFAPYNQIFQYLMEDREESPSQSGATVLLIRPEDWLSPATSAAEDRLSALELELERLLLLLDAKDGGEAYFVGLLPFSEDGPLRGLSESAEQAFRERWSARIAIAADHIAALDFSQVAERYLVGEIEDKVANEEGQIPYTTEYFAAIGTETARALVGWLQSPFKVIVVDADNTLWRGIAGEDGATGVRITPAFAAWQRLLLRKRNEGMLLALCSKNDESDLWDVFERNGDMILRKEHFAAWRINWQPKSDNLRELAEELNLGLDSLIFVDDNAAECLEVMARQPDVLTLRMPKEETMTAFLEHVWAWDRHRVTDEDRKRASSYEAERQRKEAANRPGESLEDYLRGLRMKVSFRPLSPEEAERAAQLSARTNQFNLNGIRRSAAEIRLGLSLSAECHWIVEAADRFGDYGRIGYVSGVVREQTLEIHTFLLSCRVLGRGVEHTICAGLKRFASTRGCTELLAKFRRTAKNRPFEQFLEQTGWHGTGEDNREEIDCAIFLNRISEAPSHVIFYDGEPYEPEEAIELTAASAEAPRAERSESNRLFSESSKSVDRSDWILPNDREDVLRHRAYLLPLRFPEASGIAAMEKKSIPGAVSDERIASLYVQPVGEVESAVAGLWDKLLRGGPYGREDHFFDAGGDSLQAASLVSLIVRSFGVRLTLVDLFDHPRLREMAALVDIARVPLSSFARTGEIPRAEFAELYPVSPAQRRMYFLQLFEPKGTAYQIPSALRLTGKLERERLTQAIEGLMERHEALRTSFELSEGEPFQRIHREVAQVMEERDAPQDIEALEEELRKFVRPFDLSRAPLFRVGLFRVSEDRHVLAFDIHHIIADGVSVNVLTDDLMALYEGRELPAQPIQYKDYASWQRTDHEAARLTKQVDQWVDRFATPVPKLELPSDYARPAVKDTQGAQTVVHLDAALAGSLKSLARRTDSTMFMVLLSAYAVWLSKLSGQKSFVVGTPVAGRNHPDAERLIGVFVNPLPIRISPDSQWTFEQLLAAVKQEVLGTLERQEAPFEEIVERLQPDRDLGRNPLFDAMFSMLNMAHADLTASDLIVEPLVVDYGISQFDVGLYAMEEDAGVTLIVQYATGLFREESMRRWVNGFVTLLERIAEAPQVELSRISLLTQEELRQVAETFNATETPFPADLTLPELFRRQAEKTPERVAAVFGAERLTYRELETRANLVAHRLLAHGLRSGEPIGLMTERSPAMMAGLLGILKAGGAYVPLPPDFPADRLRYMADNAGLRLVCAQANWLGFAAEACSDAALIDLDLDGEGSAEAPDVAVSPEQNAYILYTSGSTGRPKGVMIRNRSVINRIHWMQQAYSLGERDVILQKTPYSFDVSVWELFWWMLSGSSVAFLAPGAEKDPGQLLKAIEANRITTMHFVPSMLAAFLEAAQGEKPERLREKLGTLRHVFASGEALHKAHVEKFYALMRQAGLTETKLVNLYGPTEATVDVTAYVCEPDSELDYVPIGKPIDNTAIYIVGESDQAQPIGVPGELCIAGVQLAAGYANQPELTADKFVANPFVPGTRMYRTGDLARWTTDGQIQYLGRIDDQVKIRGYRIELGEIERTLLSHDAVSEAAVVAADDGMGGKRLVAYIVADRACTSGELRKHCGERLPDYMIPALFAQLERMPLTASGKADRKALPAPEAEMDTGVAYAEPTTATEQRLAALWEELLQRDKVGIDDDFFAIGGHSLKAATLAARIGEGFSVPVSVKDMFLYPTIRKMAQRIDATEQTEVAEFSIPRAPNQPHYAITPAQKQMLLHEYRNPGSLSYHMPSVLELEGELDADRLKEALIRLADRHESLRTSFGQSEGQTVQIVHAETNVELETLEEKAFFSGVEGNWKAAARAWLRPFELTQSPLFRVGLARMGPERHLLLLDIHHAVSDGVTSGILVRDLLALYENRPLPEVKAQLKDYSAWIANLRNEAEWDRQQAYWISKFADGIPEFELPYDRERKSVSDLSELDKADRYSFLVDSSIKTELEHLATRTGTTLFMVMLASYQALLGCWSGKTDIVTGVPSAGRNHPDLAQTAGLLLQTWAIRNRPEPTLTFEDWLREVKVSLMEAFEHPWVSAEDLTDVLSEKGIVRWEGNRNPLFETMFVMQNMDPAPSHGDGLFGGRCRGTSLRRSLISCFRRKKSMER